MKKFSRDLARPFFEHFACTAKLLGMFYGTSTHTFFKSISDGPWFDADTLEPLTKDEYKKLSQTRAWERSNQWMQEQEGQNTSSP